MSKAANRTPDMRMISALGYRSNCVIQRGFPGGMIHDWMRIPYFALENIYIPLIVGQEITIYGDNLTNLPIDNDLLVVYTCDIGTQSGNNYIINPTAGQVGTHSLRIRCYNKGVNFLNKVANLEVNIASVAATKKILMVGDSWVNGGNAYYAAQIRALMPDTTFTFLGTRGTTVKHEGYGGYKFQTFVAGGGAYGDPFFISGALNVPQYFIDNSVDTPDLVLINLGINDNFIHCLRTGDKLTDAEITTIINYAKTLINAFLAYNADLKIVLGIPGLCTDETSIWLNEYTPPPTFVQDWYIENIHHYTKTFVETFAEGIYNARVTCSYSPIFIDRNDYDPSAIHPNATGYEANANGLAFDINRTILNEYNLAVIWTDDYADLTWRDNYAGAATYEIYESLNGAAYTLVTETAAGATSYNNYTWQNASMKFKIRAKYSGFTAPYSEEETLTTPLVFKTNQSVLTNLIIAALRITTGKTINIDWGDSTNNDYTGINANVTKIYSATQNPYFVKISGDTDYIMEFAHQIQPTSYGDLTKWIFPTAMTLWQVSRNKFEANMVGKALPANIATYQWNNDQANCGMYGDITGLVLPSSLTTFYCSNIPTGKKLSGDLSTTVFPTGLTRFYDSYQNFTKLPRGNYKNFDSSIGVYADYNNLSVQEVSDFLIDIAAYFAGTAPYSTPVTPVKNSLFKLNGTGNGIPNAAGLAAKAAIEAAYVAAGYTATITVNS